MLQISKQGNSIVVEGLNHYFYPYNGTLEVPCNSVISVVDEGDIVLFRSASNYDVLFSAKIDEITIDGQSVTKDNVGEVFGALSNTSSGGGGLTPEQEEKLNNAVQISDYNADKASQTTIDEAQNTEINKLKGDIEGKQDIIQDLNAIREGADLGKTALQEETDPIWTAEKGNYYTKSEVDTSLESKANKTEIPTVPTNVSAFTNDAGYLTEHQSLDNYYTKTEVNASLETKADKTEIPTVPTNVSAFTNDAGYLTEHQSLDNYYTKTESDGIYATQVVVNEEIAARISDIREVKATLESKANKSEIPNLNGYATEQWVGDKGYITEETDPIWNAEKVNYYTKSEVNSSLETKANKSEIPTVPTNVSAFINDAGYLTQHQSLDNYYTKSQVDTSLESKANKTEIPTVPTNVSAFTNDAGYLTEHQTLKTINGETIVGSGDIVISGGGDEKTEIVSLNNYRPVNVFDGGWIQIENGTVLQNCFGIGSKTSRRNPNIQINEDTLWSINVAFRTPSELGVSEQVLVDIISTNTTTHKWRLHIGIQNEGRLRFLIVENDGNTLMDFEGMMPDIEPDTNYILTMYTDYYMSDTHVTFYAKLYNQKTGRNSEVLNTSYGHNIIIPSDYAKIQFGQNASGRGDTFQGLLDASQCSMYVGNKPLFRTVDKFVGQIDWNDTITLEGTLEDGSTKKFILIGIEG